MLIDWAAALKPLADTRMYHWNKEGKFTITNPAQQHDIPWLHSGSVSAGFDEAGVDCGVLIIYHDYIFKGKSIHSVCMDCFKVSVVPQTLEHVHKIAEWQQGELADLGWASKVGMERRSYTFNKWGAYFYCRGLEQARERYKIVREWVDKNLGEEIDVYIKRGCTEFEAAMGPSDKWEIPPGQEYIEAEGREKIFDMKPWRGEQAEAIQHWIWNAWDEWDKSIQKAVTYHEDDLFEPVAYEVKQVPAPVAFRDLRHSLVEETVPHEERK